MEFKADLYPKKPGVYLMRDASDKVLYIGKAKNLRTRISQYFVSGRDLRPQIPLLIAKIKSIETIVVISEKEALLLEHTLIKKHQPRYNFLLKDDKSYSCLEITSHKWPALRLVRSKDSEKSKMIFGPYPSTFAARKMLLMLQQLFPLRECSDFVLNNRSRPCILYQMHRCIAPCVNKCSQEEYQDFVEQVKAFLKGKNSKIIQDLKKKMQEASEKMEYERAGHYLETIRHIEALLEKQRVIMPSNQNFDVLGLYRENEHSFLSCLSFQKGQLIDSKTFSMREDLEEDPELFASFISQNYLDQKNLPHEILVPQLPAAEKALSSLINENSSHQVKIIVPHKGAKKELLLMAYENAKNALHQAQKKQTSREELLLNLKEALSLLHYPDLIECFDNSHISGSNPVSVMVTFQNGCYDRSRLRKYHLSTAQVFDDLKGMEEVFLRRYSNQELELPDLIIVDGGQSHLKVAQKVLAKLNIVNVDLIALTKEKGRHDFGSTQEKIYRPNELEPLSLPKDSPLLFFLQNIRDQAHKSAILFQRKTRSRSTLKSSLDEIPGIGPKKKRALLQHFKSPKAVLDASLEELKKVSLLNTTDLENILLFFKQK